MYNGYYFVVTPKNKLDPVLADYLQRVNDGRIHFSKFVVTHHTALMK